MTRIRPWAIVGLAIAAIAVAALVTGCAQETRIIVVQCDYGIVPVGAAGMTREDSANEAWRDSAICQMRVDMARTGIDP